jgi:hypothetical protein
MITPAPGQVWADNDPRSAGRTLRVDRIDGDKAVCTVLTNAAGTQRWLDEVHQEATRSAAPAPAGIYAGDQRGKVTRVAVRRMRPAGTGYRFVI